LPAQEAEAAQAVATLIGVHQAEALVEQREVDLAADLLEEAGQAALGRALRECQIRYWEEPDEMLGLLDQTWAHYYPLCFVVLEAPAWVHENFEDEGNFTAARLAIERALRCQLRGFWVEQKGPEPEELAENNQAVRHDQRPGAYEWQGFRFHSKTEIKIAEAFERAGVAFLPNCLARVGPLDSRCNREPDFLIIYRGSAAVLEVDGQPWHPPERAAQEHARDRLFRQHGVAVERYDATECYRMPDQVVAEFLRLIEAS
jgi:hypothetical protein